MEKSNMKNFWADMFYDLHECGLSEELFSIKAGEFIKDDLRRVEDAIRDFDGKKALSIIEEMKKEY